MSKSSVILYNSKNPKPNLVNTGEPLTIKSQNKYESTIAFGKSSVFTKFGLGFLELYRITEDFDIYVKPRYDVNNRYFYYDEFKFYTDKEYLLAESGETITSILATESGVTGVKDFIILEESGTEEQSFGTNNNYINYKLQPFLYRIWTGFTEDYQICEYHGLNQSDFTYDWYNSTSSKTFIVYPNDISVLSGFTEYTYVRFSGSTYYSMILEIGSNYMILEIPLNSTSFLALADYSFEVVCELGDISRFLYENSLRHSTTQVGKQISINGFHVSKKIADAYGSLLQLDENIQNYTTGIIYGNDKHKYIFKIFDKDDEKLQYNPIEISVIGVEGKYRFPITLENENFVDETES
jgi:hypothetical protein